MKPRRTHESHHALTLPGGTEDNDLWIEVRQDGRAPVLVSTWEPTPAEREAIAAGANIELWVWGGSHPPVNLDVSTIPLGKRPDPPDS